MLRPETRWPANRKKPRARSRCSARSEEQRLSYGRNLESPWPRFKSTTRRLNRLQPHHWKLSKLTLWDESGIKREEIQKRFHFISAQLNSIPISPAPIAHWHILTTTQGRDNLRVRPRKRRLSYETGRASMKSSRSLQFITT